MRMGAHAGKAQTQVDPLTGRMDYFGPMVNRAAKISFISLYITLYHFISLYFTLYHFISLYITLYHFISLYFTLFHFISIVLLLYFTFLFDIVFDCC